MTRRLISILLIAVLTTISFSGCARAPEPSDTPAEKDEAVLEFKLGESFMNEDAGKVQFPLDGLLGVPKGENCPVVFILHGAHGVEDVTQNRYYQGFSYLAEALAEQGYLAVSININRAFSFEPFEGVEYERALGIFKAYYELIRRANDGEKVFDVDLKGKADLSSINFIGHSRGGDNSMYIAKQLREDGNDAVKSVLLVASPLSFADEISYTDVPTGIVSSQYDGDVSDLGTISLFNQAWFLDQTRKTPVTMAFFYGGNHNQYNSVIEQSDSMAPPQGVTYIGSGTQRAFLSAYAVEFLDVFNRGGNAADLGNGLKDSLGFDFMPSVVLPGDNRLLPDTAMTGLQAEGMTVETAIFSKIPSKNTIVPFNPPGSIETDTPMYRISWSKAGQSITIDPKDGDWLDCDTLTLLMANDPTNTVNQDGKTLSMEVSLTDGSGATASVTLNSQTPALRYLPSKIVNLFEGMEGMPEYWSAEHYTPLGTELIKLNEFYGINLSDVKTITLRGTSNTGACILGGFQVN